MHNMNNYNALYLLITLNNALYIKALSEVLPNKKLLNQTFNEIIPFILKQNIGFEVKLFLELL